MLSNSNRLRKKKEIEKVLKTGKSIFARDFKLIVLRNNLKFSRFTIIISNKVSKKAVERNKLKRQIREIIRLNIDKLVFGYDICLLSRKSLLDKTFQDLNKLVLYTLMKIK